MKKIIIGLTLLSSMSSFATEWQGKVGSYKANGNLEFRGNTAEKTGGCIGGNLIPVSYEVEQEMKATHPSDRITFSGSQIGDECNFLVRKLEVL